MRAGLQQMMHIDRIAHGLDGQFRLNHLIGVPPSAGLSAFDGKAG